MKRKSARNQRTSSRNSPTTSRPTPTTGFVIEKHRTMLLFSLVAVLLKSLIFEPIGAWPFAFVCMAPWLIFIGAAARAPRVYFHSFLFGLVFFLVNMRWLFPATGLGYVALSVYMAAYFPLAACAIRHAIRRRKWPLAVVFPLVWVGCELLRAVVVSGFPWFFLAHAFHRVLTLIQISDLVGAYGVTFLAASVNGAVADIILRFTDKRASDRSYRLWTAVRSSRSAVTFALIIAAINIAYGQFRLRQGTITDGPRVAIIQGDFLSLVNPINAVGHDRATDAERKEAYLKMMRAAASEEPDLYLLPETPWQMYLNPEARDFLPLSRQSFRDLQRHASQYEAVVVTGSASIERFPLSLRAKQKRYNSATVFYPDARPVGRYDKRHLVYFGEVVPFRFTRLHPVYLWLNSLMPFSGPDGDYEYSLFHGRSFNVFHMRAERQQGKEYRFGIPICYEDVMPYVSRAFVGRELRNKGVDFLLNISNDGWFGRGIQQPQHLAICVFRAVENRVGIARSVNTGVSAFIRPDGVVHDVVKGGSDDDWPGECGYSVANVGVDTRYTLYSRYGDWFGWTCAAVWLLIFVDYWIVRARTHDQGVQTEPQP